MSSENAIGECPGKSSKGECLGECLERMAEGLFRGMSEE